MHRPNSASMPPAGSPERPASPDALTVVADSFSDLLRTARHAKARLLAASGDVVEPATDLLLRVVAADGPIRASALALSLQSDLSTVSRYVTGLVASGLLERRADPADGRACLLAITELGCKKLSEREHVRRKFFAEVVGGWDEAELDEFARLLARFAVSYKKSQAAWLSEHIGAGSGPFAIASDD